MSRSFYALLQDSHEKLVLGSVTRSGKATLVPGFASKLHDSAGIKRRLDAYSSAEESEVLSVDAV